MDDIFRPKVEPARSIYDAFQEEAKNRPGRETKTWMAAERLAVWRASRDYAQQHGLRVPTLQDVGSEEMCARGHVDYGSKWAYGVARLLTKPRTENER